MVLDSYIYKIITIGDSNVGKTNVISQFVNNEFIKDNRSTIGIDFQVKNMNIDNQNVKLQIWDTSGQEKFKSITKSYYRYTNAVIIVFDLTVRSSFDNIENWIEEIEKNVKIDDLSHSELLIIGNKSDLFSRKVFQKDIDDLHSKFSFVYIETSAKDNIGINEGLYDFARRIHNNRNNYGSEEYIVVNKNDFVNLEDNKNKDSCCIIL